MRKKNYLYYAIDSLFNNYKIVHTTLSYKNVMSAYNFNKTGTISLQITKNETRIKDPVSTDTI